MPKMLKINDVRKAHRITLIALCGVFVTVVLITRDRFSSNQPNTLLSTEKVNGSVCHIISYHTCSSLVTILVRIQRKFCVLIVF